MRRKTLVYLVLVGLAVFLCEISSADVPHMINYQGKLTTADGGCLNDTVQMTFSIYDDSLGMTPEWTETQTEVVVKEGVFSVLLGAVDSIPAAVFDGSTKYLGVQVEADPEMRPLKPMVSTSYAFWSHRSQEADTADYARVAPAMPDADWVINGDDIHHEQGKVGIGTTSPQVKLDIVGGVARVNGNLTPSSGEGLELFYSSSLEYGAVTAFDRTGSQYKNLQLGNGIRIASDGKVGVGTSSPTHKLDVSGQNVIANFGSNPVALRLGGDANAYLGGYATVGGQPSIYLGSNSYYTTSGWQQPDPARNSALLILQNGNFGFRNGGSGDPLGSEKMVLDSSGNVGIGTTSPATSLHLYANSAGTGATDGMVIDQDGTGDAAMSFRLVGSEQFLVGIDNSDGGKFKISDGADFGADRFVIDAGGNVGIGTANPAYKLDVAGHIRSTGTIYGTVDNADKVDGYHYSSNWPTTLTSVRTACSNDFHNIGGTDDDTPDSDAEVPDNISINNSRLYAPSGGGNVGVGTTSPGYKLDVNGDVFVRGTSAGLRAYKVNVINASFGMGGPPTLQVTNNNAYNANPVVKFEQQHSGAVTPVLSVSTAGEGRAIYASTNASQNVNAAIYGDALDDGGVGVYGHTSSRGVSGGSSVGVFGLADNSGGSVGGAAMGVFGRVYSYQNSPNSVPVGVFGETMHSTGVAWGVAGESHSTSPSAAGVKGTLKASGAQGRAIWGEAPGTGWAGYFSGNVHVTGSLSCSGSKPAMLQGFSDGTKRYIYSQESPEIWFEDFGEGQLQNGRAHVDLDVLFLETVTISEKHPAKVFVQLNNDCNGVYVERGTTGFDVYELHDGKSSAGFTYRVVAKRKGYEEKRLEVVEQGLTSE